MTPKPDSTRPTIAFDYDGTITAMPPLLLAWMHSCISAGVQAIVVTQRMERDVNVKEIASSLKEIPDGVGARIPVIFASGKTKAQAVREAGYQVDIWVEDNPSAVEYLALTYVDDLKYIEEQEEGSGNVHEDL